jgi:hypothetical protein
MVLDAAGNVEIQRQKVDPDRLDAGRRRADQIASSVETMHPPFLRQQFEGPLHRAAADAKKRRDGTFEQHHSRPQLSADNVARKLVADELIVRARLQPSGFVRLDGSPKLVLQFDLAHATDSVANSQAAKSSRPCA